MTSRERVCKVLNHAIPDRVPIDIGSLHVTGIAASTLSKLRDALGLNNGGIPVKISEPYQMLGEVTDDVRDALGIDCVGMERSRNFFGFKNENWKEWRLFDGTKVLVPGLFNIEPEPNGDILQYPEGDTSAPPSGRMPKGGFYFDAIVRQHPIDEAKLDPKDNLEEFKPISDEALEEIRTQVEYLYDNTDYAIVASFGGTGFGDIAHVPAPHLKDPKGIRDVEEWYVSLVARTDYVYRVFEGQCEIALANLEKICSVVGDKVQVASITGTDFGTQNGLFISVDLYRKLFKPFHKIVNDWVHTNTTWKTFTHTCGSVYQLIPDLIDAGFDILNPVQTSAKDMEPARLKKEFGKDVVFWGGGVDTQYVLPFGSPDEVRQDVKSRIETLGKDGGFVCAAIHNIQAGVPAENLIAMFETLRDYGRYT